ncbi:MAG: hypothetical protein HYY57_01075 [Candidatus Omnitrophica bacterium]|nr:hypothetical protein [Candidatus Omnitrophota bacterium]
MLILGCSVLTHPKLHVPNAQEANAKAIDDGFEDYAGALHIHTTYSHDAHGTFQDAVRAANAQGLDYLIITEHNHLKGLQEGLQGMHGSVLREKLSAQEIIDEVARQGGLSFIAHPYFEKARWRDWSAAGFTGMEAYNVAHDTLDENKIRLALWTLTAPAEPFYYSILDRPYDPLSKWDELIRQHGRVVGIGGTDAHEFHVGGLKFAPYEVMFQMVRTHVLIPGALTDQAVYEALRKGHAYLAIELVAPAKGFNFLALRKGKKEEIVGIMGDEITFEPDLILQAILPTPAELTLFQDGQPVATTTEQEWSFPLTQHGVYRLEAMRHGKPWIYSNPALLCLSDNRLGSSHCPCLKASLPITRIQPSRKLL